ncbi:telomeric repeat-binding factor 1 isoform X1 [Bufo gargarizans]|uniref:telomeric repeat-binding factor 1 isoform X1 n=1 Tax=Bufo gargarizans TaxID=30331 RepID=UPI001CF51C04|nr:telomeric repeat-binding factor 1 isoform X1 [Bufo gargarizans]
MDEDTLKATVSFDQAEKVATSWVFDYMFATLCHYFCDDDRAEDFQRTCRAMEVILEGIPTLDSETSKAVLISQFLTRVAEGRHLDVQYETDEKLTPLEAAAVVFDQIIEDDDDLRVLQEEIKTLVKVQAIAVCMEKGRFKLSSEVLDRQFEESETNKYLRMKMSMVVGKKDPYHEFLENFSFTKMLKKIKSYTSLTLDRRPPVFLLQAATKMVDAKRKMEVQTSENIVHEPLRYIRENKNQQAQADDDEEEEDLQKEDIATSECADMSEEKSSADQNELTGEAAHITDKATERPLRRLFSLERGTPWHPDKMCKRIISKPITAKQSSDTLENVPCEHLETSVNSTTIKKRQPWTWEEDELLKKGVKKYGAGNWSKILVHYRFNNRTGVMLKDRWRTMKKLNIVHDE